MRNLLSNSIKVCVLALFILVSAKSIGQTFPSASSCTSKDLTLVKAVLPVNPGQDPCTCGGTRTLNLYIYNKTGSTRTSFAFWGTLKIYNSDGTLASSTAISGCGGPIKKNDTTILATQQITFTCGQSLSITNLFLAWTDASPNSTCPLNSALIAPKCGTLDSIRIEAGVAMNATPTGASCAGNDGSISVSPYGGKPNYSVACTGQTTQTNIAVGGSASFTGLTPGTYTITVTDANNCTVSSSRTVTSSSIAAPTATVTQPTCTTATGTVTVNSFDNTITYQLKQSGVLKYTANSSGVFSSVATGTYDLVATKGGCTNSGSVTVDAQPQTPAAPSADVTQPTCATGTGTVTVTLPDNTITYTLTGPSPATTTQSNTTGLFQNLAPGTYGLTATKNGCTSSSTSETVNAQPPTPTFTVCITQPTLCDKGSLTINASGGSGFHYSIDGSTFTNTTGIFNNLNPGDVTSVQVQNGDGCSSTAVACASLSSTCTVSKPLATTEQVIEVQAPNVKAYPNPFSDRINFVVTTPISGKGSLDVYNMMGQKVKTVYQGFIPAGTQTFQMSSQRQQVANLIYVLRIGDKKVSGKILQINQ